MTKARNILGLAFEDDCILVAEVQLRAQIPHLRRTCCFGLSHELSLARPSELGLKLRSFLRTNHFSGKVAVAGLPAKWLVAQELTIPPTSTSMLPGIMQIKAERSFTLEAKDLVFDYCGQVDPDRSSTFLLMAAGRQRIDQIRTLAKTAGLQLCAIIPTSHALCCIESGDDSQLSVYLREDYFEHWVPKSDLPLIRHTSISSEQNPEKHMESLQYAISRLLWLSCDDGQSSNLCQIRLYTDSSSMHEVISKLESSLAPQTTLIDGNANLLAVGFNAEAIDNAGPNGAAAALTITGLENKDLFIDFLNSRMGAKQRKPHARLIIWTAVACLVIITGLITVVQQWRQNSQDVAIYSQQLDDMAFDIKDARQVVDRMSYTAGWTSDRGKFLECLRQLTGAFPQEGSVWATNLAMRKEGQGLVTGKSLREESVLHVLDSIKSNRVFRNVQLLYMRDAGRDTDEVSFAITFGYAESR